MDLFFIFTRGRVVEKSYSIVKGLVVELLAVAVPLATSVGRAVML